MASPTRFTNVEVTHDLAVAGDVTVTGDLTVAGTTIVDGVVEDPVLFEDDVTMDAGAQARLDLGTATATTGAATLSKQAGVITSEALTTAAGAAYTLTLTNTQVAATSIVLASVQKGTATEGTPVVETITPGSGSVAIVIRNNHATQALNGTIKVSFVVLNGAA